LSAAFIAVAKVSWVAPVPSALITQIVVSAGVTGSGRTNTILLPSGDQLGSESFTAPPVTAARPVLSGLIVTFSVPAPTRGASKAIFPFAPGKAASASGPGSVTPAMTASAQSPAIPALAG
jgi:hypothetical protein